MLWLRLPLLFFYLSFSTFSFAAHSLRAISTRAKTDSPIAGMASVWIQLHLHIVRSVAPLLDNFLIKNIEHTFLSWQTDHTFPVFVWVYVFTNVDGRRKKYPHTKWKKNRDIECVSRFAFIWPFGFHLCNSRYNQWFYYFHRIFYWI